MISLTFASRRTTKRRRTRTILSLLKMSVCTVSFRMMRQSDGVKMRWDLVEAALSIGINTFDSGYLWQCQCEVLLGKVIQASSRIYGTRWIPVQVWDSARTALLGLTFSKDHIWALSTVSLNACRSSAWIVSSFTDRMPLEPEGGGSF